jgi:hypothetical protein
MRHQSGAITAQPGLPVRMAKPASQMRQVSIKLFAAARRPSRLTSCLKMLA